MLYELFENQELLLDNDLFTDVLNREKIQTIRKGIRAMPETFNLVALDGRKCKVKLIDSYTKMYSSDMMLEKYYPDINRTVMVTVIDFMLI